MSIISGVIKTVETNLIRRRSLLLSIRLLTKFGSAVLTTAEIMGCLHIYTSATSDLPQHNMKILDHPWRLFGDLHEMIKFRGDSSFHF